MNLRLLSVFLLFGREAWQIADALREPVYFVSGFYFPVRALGFPVALAASVLPMTLGLDDMRQLSFSNGPTLGFLTIGVEIGILAALTVLFGIGVIIIALAGGYVYIKRCYRDGSICVAEKRPK